MTKSTKAACWTSSLVGICAALGCGSSSAGDGRSQMLMTPVIQAGAGAPKVGTATGAAGSAGSAVVTCGTKTCPPNPAAMFMPTAPPPCCVNAAANMCGYGTAAMCVGPLMVEPRCPMVSIAGMMLSPCCTTSGMCGIDASALNMGCADLANLKMFSPGTPDARRCDLVAGAAGSGAAGGASGAAGAAAGGGGMSGAAAGASGAAGAAAGRGGTSGASGAGGAAAGRGGSGGTSGTRGI